MFNKLSKIFYIDSLINYVYFINVSTYVKHWFNIIVELLDIESLFR